MRNRFNLIVRWILLIAVLFFALQFYFKSAYGGAPILYQVSTLHALLEGKYDGRTTFGELKKHGDFGLGTVNALDGEMVAVGGKFYQVTVDGKVHAIEDAAKTPFAVVTHFKPTKTFIVRQVADLKQLFTDLDRLLGSKDLFYAVKIEGRFKYVKTRSIPGQNKPYPGLKEVIKKQKIFEFQDVKGTLVGFRCPKFVGEINVPGYHFHFIASDRKRGGHVLDVTMTSPKIEVLLISELVMSVSQ
jgi:acetolactate decarboxylase